MRICFRQLLQSVCLPVALCANIMSIWCIFMLVFLCVFSGTSVEDRWVPWDCSPLGCLVTGANHVNVTKKLPHHTHWNEGEAIVSLVFPSACLSQSQAVTCSHCVYWLIPEVMYTLETAEKREYYITYNFNSQRLFRIPVVDYMYGRLSKEHTWISLTVLSDYCLKLWINMFHFNNKSLH